MSRLFGTDGVRGLANRDISAKLALQLSVAGSRVLSRGWTGEKRPFAVVGRDTRVSGEFLSAALSAGIASTGVDVLDAGMLPTPGIAQVVKDTGAAFGVVISASHNAFQDNGIKFFSAEGTKLPDEIEARIEEEIEKPLETVSADQLGKATRIDDAAGRYIEFCKSSVPHRLTLNGLKIVLDCAPGATYHIAPSVFRELGAM